MHQPEEIHIRLVTQLIKYLHCTKDRGLIYNPENKKAVWHFVSRNSEEAAAFNRRFNIVPKVSKADMRKQTLAMLAIPATPRTVPLVSALYDQDHRALFIGSSDKRSTSKY